MVFVWRRREIENNTHAQSQLQQDVYDVIVEDGKHDFLVSVI